MKYKNVSRKFIVINQIRISIAIFLIFILISLFLDIFTAIWNILAVLFSLIFIFMFVYYIPAFYKSFKYKIEGDWLVVSFGVFIYKTIYVNFKLATKKCEYQTIIQQIFKVKSLKITSLGLNVYIPCLEREEIEFLLNKKLP